MFKPNNFNFKPQNLKFKLFGGFSFLSFWQFLRPFFFHFLGETLFNRLKALKHGTSYSKLEYRAYPH